MKEQNLRKPIECHEPNQSKKRKWLEKAIGGGGGEEGMEERIEKEGQSKEGNGEERMREKERGKKQVRREG